MPYVIVTARSSFPDALNQSLLAHFLLPIIQYFHILSLKQSLSNKGYETYVGDKHSDPELMAQLEAVLDKNVIGDDYHSYVHNFVLNKLLLF